MCVLIHIVIENDLQTISLFITVVTVILSILVSANTQSSVPYFKWKNCTETDLQSSSDLRCLALQCEATRIDWIRITNSFRSNSSQWANSCSSKVNAWATPINVAKVQEKVEDQERRVAWIMRFHMGKVYEHVGFFSFFSMFCFCLEWKPICLHL